MSKRLLGAAAAVAAILVSLVPAGTAAPAGGQTAVVAIDFDPLCLNVLLGDCNTANSGIVAGPALAGAFRALPDFTFEPVLVDRVNVQAQPFALTYHIKQQAVWSDGAPVTSDDFIFTLESIRDPGNNTLKAGYENVTGAVRVDSKTVTVQFSAPNPDWRSLFPHVLPKHVLAGHDLDHVWREEIAHPVTHEPIGSGPFLVTGFTRGQSLTLTRNPRWWGPTEPRLDAIEIRVVPSFNDQSAGMRDGSIDAIFPQPQLGLADLGRLPDIALQTAPGTAMEHLDFNVGSASMPLLRESWFRQAVAFSIDRAAVAAKTYETLFPNHPALHNLSFSSVEPEYEPVFARYTYDPAAVARIMGDHGCVAGADGIYACAGVRASVKFATTSGNQLREQAQRDMAGQARAAGIELVPDNSPSSVLFGTRLGARQYELIMFTWLRGASLPSVRALYGCNGENNFMGYCSPAVTDLGDRAAREPDPAARAQLVNDANRILADDVPSLPLFLRPALLVHREELRGPQVNPAALGTWNVETWRIGNDGTPPVSTAAASPAPNASDWNRGPVTVTLTATDGDTGVRELRYTLTGAQGGSVVVPGSSAEITVMAEGTTTLEYRAVDNSGNVEPAKTLTIRIDKTAPTIACVAVPSPIWPPSGQLVPVQVAVAVADGLSGSAGFTLVRASSDEPGVGDIQGFVAGTPDTSGLVRAERSARGDGRVYTLEYEASDRAGNTASCAARVSVPLRRP